MHSSTVLYTNCISNRELKEAVTELPPDEAIVKRISNRELKVIAGDARDGSFGAA